MKKSASEPVQTKGHRTRQIILDAAEELFGETDYDAVSLRDIAGKAHVLLGQVSYHFTNKASLFEEVIARRADEITRIGIDELKRHANPSLEQIMDALILSVLERNKEPAWNSYIRIMAKVFYQDRWRPMQEHVFSPFGRVLMNALEQVLPGTPGQVIRQGVDCAVMVLLGVSVLKFTNTGDGDPVDAQPASVSSFLVGGMRALGVSASLPWQPDSPARAEAR